MKAEKKFPSPAHAQADALLLEMREITVQLFDLQAVATQELERVKAALKKQAAPLLDRQKALDKELLRLEKRERTVFFARPGDLVRLPHGTLIFNVQEHVVKAKGVLAELEAQALEEAIIIEKSVNWAVLETWPDEKLILVGTERVKKEIFSYELQERE